MTHPYIRNRPPQRILITGDRDWNNDTTLARVLKLHLQPERDFIIHGDARGADRMGAYIAQGLDVPKDRILAYPADWNRYHKAAGPIRNQQMLTEGKPTLVLAFHDHIQESKGTRDMIKRALFAKLPVYLNGTRVLSLKPLPKITV